MSCYDIYSQCEVLATDYNPGYLIIKFAIIYGNIYTMVYDIYM